MEVGIVGLPLSGKTTLFSTLSGQSAEPTYGGGKIEIHRGVVKVSDERLDTLYEIFQPKKKVPATIEYIEVGGLEQEISTSKGIDSQFLHVLKNTAAICVIIRAFENEFHPHPAGSINIERDIQTIETDFLLSDLSIVENRSERLEKQVQKAKDEQSLKELALLKRCREYLETERALREMDFSEEEAFMVRGFQFLSAKPLIIVININENDINKEAEFTSRIPEKPNVKVIALCAKVEQEISQLAEEDRALFLEELGIEEAALHKLIHTSFDLLGLISFFTVNETECHAWTMKNGLTAQKAAGTVHSDFERGFIRAEVVHYDDFMKMKSMAKCREQGLLRLEGKNYFVQDGDIITIRFNV
jgi:GTP-binding protein YchF